MPLSIKRRAHETRAQARSQIRHHGPILQTEAWKYSRSCRRPQSAVLEQRHNAYPLVGILTKLMVGPRKASIAIEMKSDAKSKEYAEMLVLCFFMIRTAAASIHIQNEAVRGRTS